MSTSKIRWDDQHLEHDDGKMQVRVDLPAGELTVDKEKLFGRYGGADWNPPAAWVVMSSRHFCVRPTPDGGLQLEDLGSTNGTFVNGQRVSESRKTGAITLANGDQINASGILFTVEITPSANLTSEMTFMQQ